VTAAQRAPAGSVAESAPVGVDLVWAALRGMWQGLLERLPYVALGPVVRVLFYLAGRLVRRAAHAAGARTRLDVRLADVFGTLAPSKRDYLTVNRLTALSPSPAEAVRAAGPSAARAC
jgi:hypothetical protein